MKRWTLRISPRRAAFGGTICLILGVVTTVGVAWWCAARANIRDYTTPVSAAEHARKELRSEFGHRDWSFVHWGEARGSGYAFNELIGEVGGLMWYRATVISGLPLHAMKGYTRFEQSRETLQFGYRIEPNDSRYPERFLPLIPVLPGFLINTLFYAAIWFGLFFAPGMMGRTRRFIRTRRGRCPRCGYDLRGELDDGCSECGWGRGVD